MELLKVENLSFAYPDQKEVLHQISFSIQNGEFVVLCGESGCGKTTLLRLLKRELAPNGSRQGVIYFEGMRQEELDNRTSACRIGYVMQNPENQIVTDKVWHELAFGLENMGMPKQQIRRRIAETAGFFGLDPLFRRKTHELSGGQKQLLNLASIMAMQPSLLILDEPTSQLDPIAASEFINTLVKLNREFGIAVLLTEHRLEEVLPVADKLAVMEAGRMVLWDTPAEGAAKLKGMKTVSGLLAGFPSAVRIYQELDGEGACPLTVRQGQDFLRKYYRNDKMKQPVREENHILELPEALMLKDVWFRYDRESPNVLESVDLKLHEGEIVSILGGNGSGKTTLLGVIANTNHAYKGKIKIFGKKQRAWKGADYYVRNLALLPQNPQLVFLKETLLEDFMELKRVMGYPDGEMNEKLQELTELLGIEHLLSRNPYDLSGGEQQKAALVKVLLLEPRILLLDEPTKGLDAKAKQDMLRLLRSRKQRGTAILMVTHDIEFAAECSDRCGMFFDRGIVSMERPAEFFGNNNFYTTAASRIGRVLFENTVTCRDVAELCRINGRREP